MNCESVTKLIPLYFYGELCARGGRQASNSHLDGCWRIAGIEAELQRLMGAAVDRREMQLSAALLAECRHDLMRAVYRNEAPLAQPLPSTPWDHFRDGFAALFPPVSRWRMPLGGHGRFSGLSALCMARV